MLCIALYQPSSHALHQLIVRTAEWCAQQGVQAEVMLKVTQANRPAFAFLQPTHPLHSYFTFLQHVTHQHLEQEQANDSKALDVEAQNEAAAAIAAATVEAQAPAGRADGSSVASGLAGGPPPGIRRRPSSDMSDETGMPAVGDTATFDASQQLPMTEQRVDEPQAPLASKEESQKVQLADDPVAEQLRAAKQRLLALIAQRAAT